MKVKVKIINVIHSHVWGSYRANFDANDIVFEELLVKDTQRQTHTHTHTFASSIVKKFKIVSHFKNKKHTDWKSMMC